MPNDRSAMRFNWFYILIGFLFAGMLFISIRYFRGSGHASVGVAYSREYRINSDKAALVKNISVVPGQQVKAGQLLVELTSSELDINIQKLTQRIEVLESELNEKDKLAQSEISLIHAESGIDIEELNSEIQESESELNLNRKLTSSLKLEADTTSNHPVAQKIRALKLQRTRHEQASAIRIKDILQQSQTAQTQLSNQIGLLRQELSQLEEEKKKLSRYASGPGVIEKIFVKTEEQVDAFTPLLSVNPLHPTMVTGYLVGKKESLAVGTEVSISGYERPKEVFKGKVIGYGSVVPLPEILQKSTAVNAFGREIFIELSGENNFASGEKVLIR